MDERREKRLRFTYAHEVGHLILHENEIKQCDFRTPEMWIHFHEDFLAEDLNWFEQQAREFGGRLLVPRQELISEILNYRDKIIEFKSQTDSEEDLIEALSGLVCDKFGVSNQVIQRRIRSEKIWPGIKVSLLKKI
jgi:Zn-dependent peptidase ImmA (M78 family)